MVYAFDAETGQRHLRLAQYLHARTNGQPRQQFHVQDLLMGGDGGTVQFRQVVQGRAKADHRTDGGRAGLETQRCGMELRALEIGHPDHLAAELPVMEFEQGFAAAVERADAFGPVELVAGQHVEVAGQGLHVVAAMHHALGAVDDGQRALGLGQRQQLCQRLPGTQHVGQLADGEQARARADKPGGGLQVDQALFVQRQYHQLGAASPGQLLPGQQVGVVFEGADDDLVIRAHPMFEPVGQQVQRLGGTVGEDDLGRALGIQPVRHLDP